MEDYYNLIINRLSLKYGKPKEVVKKAIESEFEFTRKKAKEIKIEEIKSKEDINEKKSTFNFIGLGRFHLDFSKIVAIRNRLNKKKHEDNS